MRCDFVTGAATRRVFFARFCCALLLVDVRLAACPPFLRALTCLRAADFAGLRLCAAGFAGLRALEPALCFAPARVAGIPEGSGFLPVPSPCFRLGVFEVELFPFFLARRLATGCRLRSLAMGAALLALWRPLLGVVEERPLQRS